MDDLDELLAPPGDESSGFCATTWTRARGVLRRRRLLRGARRGAAGVACFAAGGLLAWAVLADRPEQKVAVEVACRGPGAKPTPVDAYLGQSPRSLERWAAMADKEKQAALYRRAGDGYLERGDEVAALRCYHRALAGGKPADLVVRPDQDTWMLMSLKFARQREVADVRN